MCRQKNDSLPENIRVCLDKMISMTKTKLIAPVLTAGIMRRLVLRGFLDYSERDMREAYEEEVCHTAREILGHNLHVGGDYEDAYCSRTLPKYGIVTPIGDRRYTTTNEIVAHAASVLAHIEARVPEFVASKIGGVTALQSAAQRLVIAADQAAFCGVLTQEMQRSPSHFEIVSFAVLRIHLEKFACKVYRSSRTSAHDHGVDIATDYGTVYQVKKMRLITREAVEQVYCELLTNFDEGRLHDRKVVLVIDDLSSACRQFLMDMRVQPLIRTDILTLAGLLSDPEDRQKVLRVVYEEFAREYRSDICMACTTKPRMTDCRFIPLLPSMAEDRYDVR